MTNYRLPTYPIRRFKMWHEVRLRFNDLTYYSLKQLSVKIGVPITKVVKNMVLNKLVELKEIKK